MDEAPKALPKTYHHTILGDIQRAGGSQPLFTRQDNSATTWNEDPARVPGLEEPNNDGASEIDKVRQHIYLHIKSLHEDGNPPNEVKTHRTTDAVIHISMD